MDLKYRIQIEDSIRALRHRNKQDDVRPEYKNRNVTLIEYFESLLKN